MPYPYSFDPTSLGRGDIAVTWCGDPNPSAGLLVYELQEAIEEGMDTVRATLQEVKPVLAHGVQFAETTGETTDLNVSDIAGTDTTE